MVLDLCDAKYANNPQEVNAACEGAYWNPTDANCENKLDKVDKVRLPLTLTWNHQMSQHTNLKLNFISFRI